MKTINIKGKEYIEVNERIKHFRANYPDGQIQTEILRLEDGFCVIRADVFVNESLVSTGHAYEKEDSTFINKHSYIENCETSAVGRALGIFGIGIDTSIASADEVINAVNNQELVKQIKHLVSLTGADLDKALKARKLTKLEDATLKQLQDMEKNLIESYEIQELETGGKQDD